MQLSGALNKRKSLGLLKMEPELPKRALKSQERFSGKRTIHKELLNPSEQLKDYKRRLIFTESTDHSLSRLASE